MATQYFTAEGLQIPTVEELKDEITSDLRANVDPLMSTDSDSIAGNFVGVVASHLREAWEALQLGVNALNPDNAEDERLDVVCSLTGTTRDPAKYSLFAGTNTLTVTLEPGAIVEAFVTFFAVAGDPTSRWVATETVENTTLVTADFPVAARAEFRGAIRANAGTVTVIATPTTGVVAVTNAGDAVPGSELEGNEPLRRRRERELKQSAATTAVAVKADLYAYTDVTGAHPILAVEVIENTKDFTSALGVPPHASEVVLWDGPGGPTPNAVIWPIIEKNRPQGTLAYGVTTDPSNGNTSFTRATEAEITLVVTLRKDPTTYAGDDAVIAAVVATALAEQVPSIGGDSGLVAFSDYLASAWSVPGVQRVTEVSIAIDGGSASINVDVPIGARKCATLISANVTVVATDGP